MASGVFTLKQQTVALGQGAWTNQKPLAVDYLVVAGGASGGAGAGSGGGGAGGLLQGNIGVSVGSAITVTVGAGGAAKVNGTGNAGNNSVFGSITSTGGGGGANDSAAPASGGSGGGGRQDGATAGAQGTSGQGNAGGTGFQGGGVGSGGGGGGAGTVGLAAGSSRAGNGGAGIASDISGTRTVYSGGGGGCTENGSGTAGTGGAGGGGNGALGTNNGSAATANTGGGGGGGGYSGASSGAGGSGIVILSYPDIYSAAASTTGSPTISTSGSGSLYFDGTGDYLSYANGTFNLGNNDFVIESFFYVTTSGGYYTIAGGNTDLATQTGSSWNLTINNTGTLSGTAYSGSTLYQITTAVVSQNVWNHIAFVRTGGTISLFLNGVKDGTNTTLSTASINNGSTNYPPCVGANGTANVFLGYLSNTRIIIGANASNVYNATSSSITVPTKPLPSVTNTTLLLNTVSGSQFADSSGNSYVATVAGNTVWNSLSPITTGLGYKNRTYTWTSSGSITF